MEPYLAGQGVFIVMSKQLAISSAFSIFATAAVALFATSGGSDAQSNTLAGAAIEITAPAELPQMPELPALLRITN